MNRWQASIPADKVSIFNLVSLTNLSLKLQFCTKKAAMKLSSLPLKMSVSYRNRTYNRVLGGPRYIHLTKETNAVFSGFSALLAPAAISMNSITLVMNFHCILFWHSGQSLLESNSDLSLLNFHKSQPWLNLRRRLLYPFNYENECRIFGLFSHFGSGNHIYESNHFRDELPLFLIPTSQATFLESNSKLYPFCFSRV